MPIKKFMDELTVDKILVKDAELTTTKIELTAGVVDLIKETQRQQASILKLRDIKQDWLKTVVQL